MNTLTVLARGHQRDVAALRAARDRLQAQKTELDSLAARQAAQQADLATRKATIQTKIAALKKQQDDLARRQADQARAAAAAAAAAHRPPPPPPPSPGG